MNAIHYQGRTGCHWAYLPHDLPPTSATYYYFPARRDDGTDQVIHELLRCQVREKARRSEDPTLVVLDIQSVHAAAGPLLHDRPGRGETGAGASRVYWAMTQVMARRLTGVNTPTWRDPQRAAA